MKHPRREATGAALARILNVSPAAVTKALQSGRIRRNANGQFTVQEAVQDWRNNTHSSHGGKRISRGYRQPSRSTLEPGQQALLDYWMTIVEEAYPMMALGLAKEHGMAPKEVWQFLNFVFFVELRIVTRVLKIPDSYPLKVEGFLLKLYYTEEGDELEHWLGNELQQGDDDPIDPSIWN